MVTDNLCLRFFLMTGKDINLHNGSYDQLFS
jgi:hypothetical protein